MQSSCGSGALRLLYICAMKCMKYSNGGGVDRPKRRGKGSSLPAASASIDFTSGFASEGPKPSSCKGDAAPESGASGGGSGITVNRGSSGNSRAGQQSGTLSSKKRLDSKRVISVKEMARKREREQKQMMRAMKRSNKPQSNPRTLGTTSSFN